MIRSKLFHDQKIAAGEHVRIWQNDEGNIFEHVFPTGQSITICCKTLDEARALILQYVKDDDHLDFQAKLSQVLYKGEGHEEL